MTLYVWLSEHHLLTFVTPAIILILTFGLANIFNGLLKKHFRLASKKIQVDETTFRFFRRLIVILIYVIGIIAAGATIPALRTLSVSLFAGAGVAAIVLGFAMQKTMANVISGIFIASTKPFRIGDRVKIADEYGTIEDINLSQTILKTADNRRLIVPNSRISEDTIINYTINDPKILKAVDFTISYDSDIDKAKKIIKEAIARHPHFISPHQENDFLSKAESLNVRVVELGENGVKLRAHFWTKDQSAAFAAGCDVLEEVKKRFDKEGIEMPYPHMTVMMKERKRR
ncbi:MAG: mechanosensitive ion channel family protein [Nanoarchaeota archaeon]